MKDLFFFIKPIRSSSTLRYYNIININHGLCFLSVHFKNTGVKRVPERDHWGHIQFRVNDDPEIGQLAAEYDPELSQSDPIICKVCRKLTKFCVTFDPECSMTPTDGSSPESR